MIEPAVLLALLVWMLPFLLGGRLRLGHTVGRRGLLSVAAGVSVGYVFIDLLPELAHMQTSFSAAATESYRPFPHLRVYSAALVGFVVFYALENLVIPSRATSPGAESADTSNYWPHIAGFVAYGALMSYLLRAEGEQDPARLALYSVTMFLHLWTVDHALREAHGKRYDRSGRWAIVAGIVAGAGIAAAGLASDQWVPTITGFIGGGVVINSLKDELPGRGEGRVLPFVAGAFGYSLLLLLLQTRH